MTATPLPDMILEPLVRAALLEDLGTYGDITTRTVIPAATRYTARLNAREAGVVSGLQVAALAFRLVDPALVITAHKADGDGIAPGDLLMEIEGRAASILSAERVALNFPGRLSGIATMTAAFVAQTQGTATRVTCTRKTTPGLRALEKYAVRAGGGSNHRYSLADAVLIKDNHIAIAGDVTTAIHRAQEGIGHMVKIEVEVDTLDQLRQALEAGADVVLLDNMTPDTLRQAVAITAGRAVTEASGNITPDTAAAIAASGVDLLAVGWITHSAPTLDIGLDFVSVS